MGLRVRHVDQLAAARDVLAGGGIDAVVIDLSLLDTSGRDTVQAIRLVAPQVPIVVLTAGSDDQFALELLSCGVQDFLFKDEVEPKLLARSVRYAIERQRATVLASLNEQLEQAKSSLMTAVADLERTNGELAQFTYFASHDLQEPIRKINYFAGELVHDLGQELNDEARRDLHYIADAARRMQALVQSLLTLARAGNGAMESKWVELEGCVNDVLRSQADKLAAAGAQITRDPLPTVRGDATLLRQLYENLIANALKFTNGAPPRIHLSAAAADDQWLLGVHDNGIGIEPEFAQKIFSPFQRLHGRGKYEGEGIGLAICKKVVDRLGGRIWVESEPGHGSHFHFLLPAQSIVARPAAARRAENEFCLASP
jgi:light-regulated signal transduction histidine kinase (bacteriophytochrome)/CheY-like chemotaxis protein